MTQCQVMRKMGAAALASAICFVFSTGAQTTQPRTVIGSGDPVAVITEHPRLFLPPGRLRLLKRERERASMRWQTLDSYVASGAPMPESGFAQALYYQVSGNATAGRAAVSWALGPGATDLRQLAIVFDWCQPLLSDAQRRDLQTRIRQRMEATAQDQSMAAIRSRVLAAVALYDHVPDVPNRELESAVHTWWEGKMAPSLARGTAAVPREDAYALWEFLHALRDSTNLDLRETNPRFFQQFPLEHLMSHYPLPFKGDDNDFRVPASAKFSEPDPLVATFSRAAELAMVAYDTNAEQSQYLQGWLMHDNFMMRSPLGATYEFLWANPYQPGLSFTLLPVLYHNRENGRLFLRSDWDDTADWFGYFDGTVQLFEDGRLRASNPAQAPGMIRMPNAVIYLGSAASKMRVKLDEDQDVVVLAGLMPGRTYQIEIDDEEVYEDATDPGGILILDLQPGKEIGVRLKELRP
jgi:hypothetical protein